MPENIHQVFGQLEEFFHHAIAEYSIKNAQIERGRWDEPTVVLTWLDRDGINRNVAGFVTEELDVEVELNAWIDSDRYPIPIDSDEFLQNTVVRIWMHEQLETVNSNNNSLQEVVFEACEDAIEVEIDDFDNVDVLQGPTQSNEF